MIKKLFLFFIIALIFYNSGLKYGTDLPVICLLFIIQIYGLKFYQKPNSELIVKSTMLFVLQYFKSLCVISNFLFTFLIK